MSRNGQEQSAGAEKLKIALVASEVAPFAKTGGLADVSAALAAALHDAGDDVRLFLPFYGKIERSGRGFRRVPGTENKALRLGGHELHYSLWTAPLPGSTLEVYFVDCPALFQRQAIYCSDGDEHLRFAGLTRAAIECCQAFSFSPDIFHFNDWHTALGPLYLQTIYAWDTLFRRTRTVLTLHNLGYQGVFPAQTIEELDLADSRHLLHQERLQAGALNFLETGLIYADVLTTVSHTYSREIQTPEFGFGLHDLLRKRSDHLVGIVNGIDDHEWNPQIDPLIPYHYSKDDLGGKKQNKVHLLRELNLDEAPDAPVFGLVSRFTEQKGLDLAMEALPALLDSRDLRLAILGSGEERYERFFAHLQQRYPGRVCFYRGYSEELAHLIEAGSDIFVMPSRYEPCGLNQMYSLRYGTIPVVRRTGGLADTVQRFDPGHVDASRRGTGFVFEEYSGRALAAELFSAERVYHEHETWLGLMQRAMAQDFSWKRQVQHYRRLYRKLSAE